MKVSWEEFIEVLFARATSSMYAFKNISVIIKSLMWLCTCSELFPKSCYPFSQILALLSKTLES